MKKGVVKDWTWRIVLTAGEVRREQGRTWRWRGEREGTAWNPTRGGAEGSGRAWEQRREARRERRRRRGRSAGVSEETERREGLEGKRTRRWPEGDLGYPEEKERKKEREREREREKGGERERKRKKESEKREGRFHGLD